MIELIINAVEISELTSDELMIEIKNTSKILVKFFIPDCHGCEKLKPIFESVVPLVNIPVVEHNCKSSSICGKYGIYTFPSIILFVDGEEIKYHEDKNAYQLANWVDSEVKFLETTASSSTINISTSLKLKPQFAELIKLPMFIETSEKNEVEIENKKFTFSTEEELILLLERHKFNSIQKVDSYSLRKMQESRRISLIYCGKKEFKYENDEFIVKKGCEATELLTILGNNQMPFESVIFFQQKGVIARYATFSVEKQKIEDIVKNFKQEQMVTSKQAFKNEL